MHGPRSRVRGAAPLRTVFIFALMVGAAGPVAAAGGRRASTRSSQKEAQAQAHYKRGEAAFRAGDYDRADVEFEAGYSLSDRPLFLLNMADAERRAGPAAERAVARQHVPVDGAAIQAPRRRGAGRCARSTAELTVATAGVQNAITPPRADALGPQGLAPPPAAFRSPHRASSPRRHGRWPATSPQPASCVRSWLCTWPSNKYATTSSRRAQPAVPTVPSTRAGGSGGGGRGRRRPAAGLMARKPLYARRIDWGFGTHREAASVRRVVLASAASSPAAAATCRPASCSPSATLAGRRRTRLRWRLRRSGHGRRGHAFPLPRVGKTGPWGPW